MHTFTSLLFYKNNGYDAEVLHRNGELTTDTSDALSETETQYFWVF
jgi:hypothetical protein